MTRPLTKEQLEQLEKRGEQRRIREEWIRRLRSEGLRQCYGTLREQGTDRVCALGLLEEVAYPPAEWRIYPSYAIGEKAGLLPREVRAVEERNDGIGFGDQWSFYLIADLVEALPL